MNDVILRICNIKIQNHKNRILHQAIKELISEKEILSTKNNFNVNLSLHNSNKSIDFYRNTECGCKYCSTGKIYSMLKITRHKLQKMINNGDDLIIDEDNIKKRIEDIDNKLIFEKQRLNFFKNLLSL